MFSKTLITSLCALLPYVAGAPVSIAPRSGTTTESISYILPIWEGSLATDNRTADLGVLQDMISLLGPGGTYTKLGWSFSSWALSRDISDASTDYAFDPTNLNYMLGLAVESNLPILVHMNDGRWSDCCTPNSAGGWSDALLAAIAADPSNTTELNLAGQSQFSYDAGGNYFSLSRLNTVYRKYKKRNIQAAASILAQWGAANPNLFVGVSLDSETIYPNDSVDFNPFYIAEWKQWLQNTGIYGPGGTYFGQGRIPSFPDIASFNAATGQNFASYDALYPPNSVTPGDPFSEEWQRWRITAIIHHVSDATLWQAEMGIARENIYGHQTPRVNEYALGDALDTDTADNGGSGVTQYGWAPANFGQIDNAMRGEGRNNIGNFELNPLTNDVNTSYNSYLTLWQDGMKVICPNSWEINEAAPDQYALFQSPNYGDSFGNATNKFLADFANTKRFLEPAPWNPGTRVYDFYDSFGSSTNSGPDNRLVAAGTVGNVPRKSVYSAVGGSVSYEVALPAPAPGQRLNLWTSLGILDGAGPGRGSDIFQITINGANLFGPGETLTLNYWIWKRWQPMMVDVTPWGGSTVTVTFTTTGNSYYGWTVWGAPAVYETTTGNNLALGKCVTASSTDGAPAWDTSFLTDGNIDGGTQGRNGWSSVSHPSPAAWEWVQIDLGSAESVGKVVLFARSDLMDFGGGVPVDFLIQGSTDGANWNNLAVQTDYPGLQPGSGGIFAFENQVVRYVRVSASKLGGVGQETGYRMQFVEIEVFEG